MSPRRITEVKRHFDGRVDRWDCDALVVTPDFAAIAFVTPKKIVRYPKGTHTFGYYWRRRPYNL